MSIFNNNKLDPFGTNSLFDDINKTNQQINSMNLPQPKPKNPYRQQNIGNMLLAFSDVLKGRDPSAGVMQRTAMLDAQKKEDERKAAYDRQYNLLSPDQKRIVDRQNVGIDLPDAKQRESFVAKDGHRYFVDNGKRVFPEVTVKEEQSEADIYKENAARIKNIVMNETIDSPNLTQQERDFYNDYINKQGFMSINEAIAASLIGGNSNLSNNSNEDIIQDGKTYSYVRTNEDGKKVYVNDGKEYVFQD
jgi:hypothetical protein